jgi:predicted DNA-binding transcriptional regulator AlpA
MSDERRLIDWKRLKELGWPYSRQHTWRLIDQGLFPKPIKFGRHRSCRVFWYLNQVAEAINAFAPQD